MNMTILSYLVDEKCGKNEVKNDDPREEKKTTFSSLESKHEKNVTLKFYIKLFRNVLLFDELPFLGGVFNELASGGRVKKKKK